MAYHGSSERSAAPSRESRRRRPIGTDDALAGSPDHIRRVVPAVRGFGDDAGRRDGAGDEEREGAVQAPQRGDGVGRGFRSAGVVVGVAGGSHDDDVLGEELLDELADRDPVSRQGRGGAEGLCGGGGVEDYGVSLAVFGDDVVEGGGEGKGCVG